jgi:hypothetical protein
MVAAGAARPTCQCLLLLLLPLLLLLISMPISSH